MENNCNKENGIGLKQRLAELAKHYQQVETEDVTSSASKSSSSGISLCSSAIVTIATQQSPGVNVTPGNQINTKTPQANHGVVAPRFPQSASRTPAYTNAKTPSNTPAVTHANNLPLPDECAQAAVSNKPVSKVAAIWEQRCREEAAQIQTSAQKPSNKRRSRSGSPSVSQIAKRVANTRAYSPVSTGNEDSCSSITTGDYLTAPSTSESELIPPPVPPPLHAAPTVILHSQPGYGQHQRTSSNVQEMRLSFEGKLAALGFEMVGRSDNGAGVAAVKINSPVTVRAEPAVGVSRGNLVSEPASDRLPPSGVSRTAVNRPAANHTPQSRFQQSDEDSSEISNEEDDLQELVNKARQQVDAIIRQEFQEDTEMSDEVQERNNDEDDVDDDAEVDAEDSDSIFPMQAPPPPPRGRSFGGGNYNSDAVSTDSTSAWNSMEDIHAAVGRSGSRRIHNYDNDSNDDDQGDPIDSLSFASSEDEEDGVEENTDAKLSNSAPIGGIQLRKSSAKEIKKEPWVEEREREYKRQLIIQDGVIQQTMKALLECQSRRQEHLASAKKKSKLALSHIFGATKVEPTSGIGLSGCTVGSLAEAEFYRVLLIANERRKAILSELRRLGSRRTTIVDKNSIPPVTVTISDIQLQLKHEYRMRQINAGDQSELYYFVVLLRHGPTVLHTVCIGTDEARDGCIQFPNMLQFNDVRAVGGGDGEQRDNDLSMKIAIYGLTLPRDVPASYEVSSKNKKSGTHHVFGHHGQASPTSSGTLNPGAGLSTPFYCVDTASITREIIRQAAISPRGLASVPLNCMTSKWPLMPTVKFRARCALSAPIEHSGFLTLFTCSQGAALPAWHRRWAHLRTTEIFFYTEPDAEPSQTVQPLPCFDLHDVSSDCSEAKQVSPYKCARPWTIELLLQADNSSASSVTSSYDNDAHAPSLWFAADTRQEFFEWQAAINRALSAISLWGLIGKNGTPASGSSNTALGSDSDQFNSRY